MPWVARAVLAAALAAIAIVVGAVPAGAATVERPLAESNYSVQPLCGEPGPGEAACLALRLVPRTAAARARATPIGMTVHHEVEPHIAADGSFGLRPQDLHSAYGLPTESPVRQTIAIVDAYDDPTAEADLAHYDQEFGLPECTTANGCFSKVNQAGAASPLPPAESSWGGEIALDVESAHAVCQNCKILLVEANDAFTDSLEVAEDTAAALGATEISNSYGGPAEPSVEGSAYDHPGVVITASTGDHGYLDWDNALNPTFIGHPEYPASSPEVVAVGGTRLMLAGGAWSSERVWNSGSSSEPLFNEGAGGSACSEHLSAQPWQTAVPDWGAVGCGSKRAAADVAADADPFTGVAVYHGGSWATFGGTSLASPIIASVFALAGGSDGVDYPAQTLYGHLGGGGLHDITTGSNGACAKGYDLLDRTAGCTVEEEEAGCGGMLICKAASGYDGPTGVGTPSGLTAFVPPAPVLPVDIVAPSITGSVIDGGTLTASNGIWFHAPTSFTYRWLRCDSSGAGCAAIEGATEASYRLVAADVGHAIEVEVTAYNAGGQAAATSAASPAVVPPAPTDSVAPSISGTAVEGQALTAGNGTWTHDPTSFTYRWLRCDSSGANCAAISGATSQTYTLTATDAGHKLKVEVTAHNAGGEGSATSAASAIVVPP
ncbi:MAG TPA: hypothetical protein VHV53_05725, partial [Solirubrobacterales bacterium]|nr:hypothetical protein [Solirubrobacterales bacterium]